MSIADRSILLVDSSKFGMTALMQLADLREFDVVLTDGGLPVDVAQSLIQDDVKLKICKDPQTGGQMQAAADTATTSQEELVNPMKR